MTDQDPVEGRRQEIIRRASVKDYTWALGGLTCQADIEFLLAECDRLSAALGAREREGLSLSIQQDPLAITELLADGQAQRERQDRILLDIMRALGRDGAELPQDRWADHIRNLVAESARLLQALEGLIKEWREQQQLHRTAFERTDPKDAAWIEKMLTCSYTFGMCANELSEALASCVRHPAGADKG